MKWTFFLCLSAVCFTTLQAGPASRGGKGGGCKDRRSPCVDGSAPLCRDGSQPDKNARHPSCSAGGRPMCEDGSEPRPPNLRESGGRGGDSSSRSGRDRPRRVTRHGRDNDGSESRTPSEPRRGGRHGRDNDGAGRDNDSNDVGRDTNYEDEIDCDNDMDDTTRLLMIGACAGGGALMISLCSCAYCWRRAAGLANARAKVHATEIVEGKTVVGCVDLEHPDTHSTVVVGQVIHTVEFDASKVAAPSSGVGAGSAPVASNADDAA